MKIRKTKFLRITSFIVSVVIILSSVALTAYADSGEGYLVATNFIEVNTGKDVSDDIQKIIDENPNRTIFFPDGEYLFGKPIYTPADPKKSVSLKLSGFATFKAIGDWPYGEAIVQLGGKDPMNTIFVNGSNYFLEGGIIDGNKKANGISINSGRETAVSDVSIKNTIVGLHIKYGANSGSSDSDISSINIVGAKTLDSVGILLEGYDNTITNVRIGRCQIGVHLKSGGNIMRNIHPLYQLNYEDYQNACAFLDESGNNWYDYCYSDQFGVGFRTTGSGKNIYHNCFCYWYSSKGDCHTAFKADKKFNAIVTNFKIGFRDDTKKNVVLSVGELGGKGLFEHLDVDNAITVKDASHLAYVEEATIFGKAFGYCNIIFNIIRNFFISLSE